MSSSIHRKTTLQDAWAHVFDQAPAVRESIHNALQRKLSIHGVDSDTIATWRELIEALRDSDYSPSVESIQGVYTQTGDLPTPALYVVPEYDWDGGSPISTATFNLESIASASIGGATARLMSRQDANRPGLVMHHEHENNTLTFQIC